MASSGIFEVDSSSNFLQAAKLAQQDLIEQVAKNLHASIQWFQRFDGTGTPRCLLDGVHINHLLGSRPFTLNPLYVYIYICTASCD